MNTLAQTIITDEDQQTFNDLAADFAGNEVAESIHEYEYPYHLDPSAITGKITDLGFYSINLPSEYGGLGMGPVPTAGIMEKFSLTDAGLAGTLFANTAALEIISAASESSDCSGIYDTVSQPGALPLAFPAYASPAETSVPAFAKRDGAFLLSGRAGLVVSGATASYAVIPAKGGDGSHSCFLVCLNDREVQKSAPVVTIGMQSCRPVDIELNGARGVLIGKEGQGNDLFDMLCGQMSYPACGIYLGIMKASFTTALEYCEQRYQGGRMIVQWKEVSMKLAGMGTLIALAEACVCGLRSMFASKSVQAVPSAIAAAVHLGKIASDVTSEGIQLLGGNGYMKDYGQEKRMRDVKQAQSLLGSSLLRKARFIDKVIQARQDSLQ
jgi:alkylation response protein AidB-like acyl-CoA dehydrogenase